MAKRIQKEELLFIPFHRSDHYPNGKKKQIVYSHFLYNHTSGENESSLKTAWNLDKIRF